MCPQQDDILKKPEGFKISTIYWVTKDVQRWKKISLNIFQKCILPIFGDIFNTDFLNSCLFERPWNSNDSSFGMRWMHSDTVTESLLSVPRAQANNLIYNLRVTPSLVYPWKMYVLNECLPVRTDCNRVKMSNREGFQH